MTPAADAAVTPAADAAGTTAVAPVGDRAVLLIVHTGRAEAVHAAHRVAAGLAARGFRVRVLSGEHEVLGLSDVEVVPAAPEAASCCEVVVVLGGDGTLLRGAEIARAAGVPLMGVNLGHIGFLAEVERDDLATLVDRLDSRDYVVEERMTVDVSVLVEGRLVATDWALNEASVEKGHGVRMIEVIVEVDGRPLSRWGCDGVLAATPTGSTAYAFSAGGPVVWPGVEALLLVPLSAHALFARPLVVSPRGVLAAELLTRGGRGRPGTMWCDGRRRTELPAGARVEVRRGALPVRLARLHTAPFTDRLVAKFGLPVGGWRGRTDEPTPS